MATLSRRRVNNVTTIRDSLKALVGTPVVGIVLFWICRNALLQGERFQLDQAGHPHSPWRSTAGIRAKARRSIGRANASFPRPDMAGELTRAVLAGAGQEAPLTTAFEPSDAELLAPALRQRHSPTWPSGAGHRWQEGSTYPKNVDASPADDSAMLRASRRVIEEALGDVDTMVADALDAIEDATQRASCAAESTSTESAENVWRWHG